MIEFSKFELANGLRVLVHEDDSTPMVAVNILYNVGARDESPDKTGFAHLFEHLMFSGSLHIPDFDNPIQLAGGDSNAFTNNDLTNFYDIVPAENLETVFWLESDRMLSLSFSEKALEVQQKVVVEEFKESCLNQPYGDVWHHLADLAYKVHPYRWPTIGKVPKHVEDATMEDVKDFFYKYYRPNNAIMVVAGQVKEAQIRELSEKWFGEIPRGSIPERQIPQEPQQQQLQERIRKAKVPVDALYLAFHTPPRIHSDYYATDLISDVLCNGNSSRLYRKLLKERKLFTYIDSYITGNIDPGLLIIEGRPAEGVSLEVAEAAIWEELELLKKEPISKQELQKFKNKIESTLIFSEANILNKAINLAFFELLGDPDIINKEVELYEQVTSEQIWQMAQQLLTRDNCSKLFYQADQMNNTEA
ncbi:MAG: pitrilysin family protein [Bacteroidota bacterium]